MVKHVGTSDLGNHYKGKCIFLADACAKHSTDADLFKRYSAVNMASPKRPRQEIKIASAAKIWDSWLMTCSF